jgi:hypothetical protein
MLSEYETLLIQVKPDGVSEQMAAILAHSLSGLPTLSQNTKRQVNHKHGNLDTKSEI